MGFQPTTTLFVNEDLAIWLNWPNESAVLWELICMIHWLGVFIMPHMHLERIYTLHLCECQVTHCLKQTRYLKSSDCNKIPTHNHCICKTLNHLAKLAKLLTCVWGLICMVALTVSFYHDWISKILLFETSMISEI